MISGSDAVGFGSAAARRFHGPYAVPRGDLATEGFASGNPSALCRIANRRNKLLIERILKQRAVCFPPCFPRRSKPGINRMVAEKQVALAERIVPKARPLIIGRAHYQMRAASGLASMARWQAST